MDTYIINTEGTSDLQAPPPYDSWLEYWENNGGSPLEDNTSYICPSCGEAYKRENFDGSHVQKFYEGNDELFIIPLCDGCNHKTTSFLVDEKLLVSVP